MKKIVFTMAATALLFSGQALKAQKVEIDTEKSGIEWLGKKISGKHNGQVEVQSGFLILSKSGITGGEVVVDMNSITVEDIKKEDANQKLVGHLKSDDFFGVATYPGARIVITQGGDFKNGVIDLKGELTIKNSTEPINFVAEKIGDAYVAKVDIDRSKFDVRYGSKSFFNNLGDNAINDNFTLTISLLLQK